VLDRDTIGETLKELVCGGCYALDAEHILHDELQGAGLSDSAIALIIDFAQKQLSRYQFWEEWVEGYASELCKDPIAVVRLLGDSPSALQVHLCLTHGLRT